MADLAKPTRGTSIGIAAPVALESEVDALARFGATELYTGVTVERWTERFGGLAWLNRRGAGIGNPNLLGLERLVAEANRCSLPVAVALNAPYYTRSQLPDVVALCAELAALGVRRVIVSDPGLILALRAAGSPLAISASSVAAIRNQGAVEFYRDLGVQRVILPRHMSLDDIARIRDGVPDVELEVFVLNDGCTYEEGSCLTTHAAGAFCLTEWRYDFSRLDGAPVAAEEQTALDQNAADYKEWIWYLSNCGRALSPRRLPNGPCGLCAISEFRRVGVDCLKIVGREAHPARKALSLQLVKAVVDKLGEGATGQEAAAFARDVRDTPELCGSGYMCYYREASSSTPAATTSR